MKTFIKFQEVPKYNKRAILCLKGLFLQDYFSLRDGTSSTINLDSFHLGMNGRVSPVHGEMSNSQEMQNMSAFGSPEADCE